MCPVIVVIAWLVSSEIAHIESIGIYFGVFELIDGDCGEGTSAM